MQTEVLCIGHSAFDLSAFVEDYPLENSKSETRHSLESCGGPAANAAWLLSFWGLRCAFAGLVGDDVYGQRIRDEFLTVGTDVSLLELRSGHPTPLSLILINQRNASRTIVNRKVPAQLNLDKALLHPLSPKVLLFDGHELAASLAALEAFPDAISILDAGSLREGTSRLAGKVHYLAASERFALQVTGMTSLRSDANRRLCVATLRERFAPSVVIVTLGEHGLALNDGCGYRHLPAFPARAVDTTAAGDIFHGALAFAIARDFSVWEGLRFAAMTASLSVRMPGGRSSIPALAQVLEAIKQL